MSAIDIQNYEVLDERIDKYLHNLMTEEEEEQFLKDIESDDILRKRANTLVLLAKSIINVRRNESTELLDEIKGGKTWEIQHDGKPRNTIIIPLWMKVSSITIAAGFLTLFGNNYLLSSNVNSVIEGVSVDITDTRGSGFDSHLLKDIVSNINNNKDLTKCIGRLEPMFTEAYKEEDQDTSIIGWYLSIAYIKEGKKDKAKAVLQKVIEINPGFTDAWKLRDELNKTFFWQ